MGKNVCKIQFKIAIFSLFCTLLRWQHTHSHNVAMKMQSQVIIFVYFLSAVRPISLVTNISLFRILFYTCDRFSHLFLFRIPLHLNFPIADRREKRGKNMNQFRWIDSYPFNIQQRVRYLCSKNFKGTWNYFVFEALQENHERIVMLIIPTNSDQNRIFGST